MIKSKQKTVRIFEITADEIESVEAHLKTNKEILINYPLVFSGTHSEGATAIAKAQGFCVIDPNIGLLEKIGDKKTSDTLLPLEQKKVAPEQGSTVADETTTQAKQEIRQTQHRLYLDRPVRSGEELYLESDITLFKRINAGSKIICEGSVEIFDTVDGFVECNGDYLLLKHIGLGSVVFHGENLKKSEFFGNKLVLLSYKDGIVKREL